MSQCHGEVIVTCVEQSYTCLARARFAGWRRGDLTTTASCTSGVEYAVKAAAMKLLGGSEKTCKAVCIEDSGGVLPRKTKWRVTR
ncbi:MAG: hypothetical protein ABMA13_23055 [Chthoniobacteraceae bacterium]